MKIYFYEHLIGTGKLIDIDFHYCMEIDFELVEWIENPKSIFAQELNKRIYQKEEYIDCDESDNHNTYKNEHYSKGLYIEYKNEFYNFSEYSFNKQTNTISTGRIEKDLIKKEEFLFFWETKHTFSQWHKCSFEENGITFNTAEQFMMYKKALLFDDVKIAEKIIKTTDPKKCKNLGRLVSNFDEGIWKKNKFEIVYNANLLKFSQNEELKKEILETKGKTIVEASPDDKIWGVGLSSDNELIKDRKEWLGTNLLGIILTELRENEF